MEGGSERCHKMGCDMGNDLGRKEDLKRRGISGRRIKRREVQGEGLEHEVCLADLLRNI